MLKKLLCIACSEERIALCQFTTNWRGSQLLDHQIIPINNLDAPQSLAKDLAAAIDRHNLWSDQYKISLPAHTAILRNWDFPFTTPKQIAQALEFELEQEIPFTSEEVITDLQFGAKTPLGRKAVSATVHKEFLSTIVEELQNCGIDPQHITIDAFSLAKIAGNICTKAPTLLLNIDAQSTQLVCLENNVPCAVSQIPYGIQNIKQALQLQLSATPDAIERLLFFSDISMLDDTVPSDEQTFKEALISQLQHLAKQILLSANADMPSADFLLICGDLARLQGIEKFFTEELGLPTTAIHKHPNASKLFSIEDKTDWLECLPALALAPAKNTNFQQQKTINFRKDEFSFSKKRDPLVHITTYATVLACILMVTFSLSLFAQGHQNDLRATDLNTNLKKTLQKALPKVNKSFGTIQYTSILKSRLAQLHGKSDANGNKAEIDSLDLLLALHKNTPKSLDIAMEAIRITEKNIGLVGTTNSYNTLEKLRSQLAKNSYFKAVTIRGATNQKKQKRIRFELEIEKAG